MKVALEPANIADAKSIAALRASVAARLTDDFGKGAWSSQATEKWVLYAMRVSNVFVVRRRKKIIAALDLGIKKPWAIDRSYFTACTRALYLTGMAVAPELQRTGLGRAMLEDAQRIAQAWLADAIRLDAYNAAAGAGKFYAKCGYREMGRVVYRKVSLIYYELMLPMAAKQGWAQFKKAAK